MQPPSINSAVSALRFFFTVTLDRPDLSRRLTVVPYPRRNPLGTIGSSFECSTWSFNSLVLPTRPRDERFARPSKPFNLAAG
jgi:hypothetical protein